MSTLGWLASTASSCFVCATLIQAMVAVYDFDFVFANWKYILMAMAVMVVTIFFNTWGATVLPTLEIASLASHVSSFLLPSSLSGSCAPRTVRKTSSPR
jgi:choline transport protein